MSRTAGPLLMPLQQVESGPVARMYVTDLQHLLDQHGKPPEGPTGALARYFGLIIEAASGLVEGEGRLLPICCSNPTSRRRCLSQLEARVPNAGTIEWRCIGCGEGGVITNWAGGTFDLGRGADPEHEVERGELVAPLSEVDAALRRCPLPKELRRSLVRAAGIDSEYLFVLMDYRELVVVRDAARDAADGAAGEDRRRLDRLAARADAIATTLPDFFEPAENPSELLN